MVKHMKLTDAERKVLKLDECATPSWYVEESICNIYDINISVELAYNLSVTLNFLKRMILEYAKNNQYSINGDEKYDMDEFLKSNIEISDYEHEKLPGFDPLYYKDPKKLKIYFDELTNSVSWKNIGVITGAFRNVTDSFRCYFYICCLSLCSTYWFMNHYFSIRKGISFIA